MAPWRRLGVVVVVLALTTTLFGANLALGAERTVLNAGFVTATLAEEDVYDDLLALTRDRVGEAGQNASGDRELPVSQGELLERVVTPAYLRSQTEANVEATIAYLHGDRDELVLVVDLRPAKARAGDVLAAELGNMTPAELFGLFEGGTAIDATAGGQPSIGLVGRMAANESAYEAARADFRESVVEAAVANRTDEAFETASDDELLALVVDDYDPGDYDAAEKERMVSEREPAIREALHSRIRAEVEGQVDEVIAARREAVRADVEEAVADAEVDPALADAFRRVALLGVDGLTADLSYDEFRERALDARDDLAVALSAAVTDGLDADLPDEVVLTETLDPGAREGLATARTVVRTLDRLAVGLWLLALGLVGALWLLTRSVGTTALWSGVPLFAAGTPVALAATWASGRLRALRPADPTGARAFDVFVSVADRVLGAVAAQSVTFAVLGVILVAVGLAVRLDLLPDDRPWGAG